ncbi:MAG: hypothetical protein BRD28_01135, partial [Bacteroidetes bacterium QH_10_64_37]
MTTALVLVGVLRGLAPLSAHAQETPIPDTTATDTATTDAAAPDTMSRAYQVEQLRPRSSTSADSVTIDGGTGEIGSSINDPTTPSSSAPVDTGLVRRYLPARDGWSPGLFTQPSPFLGPQAAATEERSITLDSTRHSYILNEKSRPGGPMRVEGDTYRRERYRANLRNNWRTLTEQRRQQQSNRGGLGVNMMVPGG